MTTERDAENAGQKAGSPRVIKAIGLHSGGLDSILADKVVRAQGVLVRSIHFFTGLCGVTKEDIAAQDRKLGLERELVDISGPEYIHMVTHPKFGYGAHANPCIDCRIFMLKKAKEMMEAWGADFVFTGEVMGQRPKSQRRDAMRTVERESGLEGRLVRPLSAQFLEPTVPEMEGLLDRSKLLGLKGRTRTPQMELARAMGIREYPQPAGGCWLTDENFGRRFHDLLSSVAPDDVTQDQMRLLLTGRHFRIGEGGIRLVVARNEGETQAMEAFAPGRIRLECLGVNGPVALVEGCPDAEEKRWISSIVARYGQGRALPSVDVEWRLGDGRREVVSAEPVRDDGLIDAIRI